MNKKQDSGPPKKATPQEVRDALMKQGYPLEMEVANEAMKADFRIVQSSYYNDPDQDTPREIDVVAERSGSIESDGEKINVNLLLVVECKMSTHNWVVFTNKSRSLLNRSGYIASNAAESVLQGISWSLSDDDVPLHSSPCDIGYQLAEIRTENNEQNSQAPYKALTAATKAARAFIDYRDGIENEPDAKHRDVTLAVPVIVFGGPLFRSHLDEQNKLHVEEIEQAVVAFRNPQTFMQGRKVMVRVVQKDAFPKFVMGAKETIDQIAEDSLLAEEAIKHMKESNKKRPLGNVW